MSTLLGVSRVVTMQHMSAVLPQRSPYVSPERPIASDPDVLQRVSQAIAMVYEGTRLKVALEQLGLTRAMFASAVAGQRELAVSYARAREIGADFLVEEALEVVVSEPNQIKARNVADMHRWAAGKFNSKRYGDRIDLNVTQTLDITSTLLEARQRALRPVSDQHLIEDAQVVDATVLSLPEPSDSQSVTADPGPEPDIFAAPAPAPAQAPTDEDVPDIFS